MTTDAKARRFDVLLVHDLSRFARNEELGHAVFNLLELHKIRLINASSDIDYGTAEGRMMLSIDLGLGSYWSRKMSFHIKKAKREKFELGLHVGDVPFGYAKGATNKDPLVPVPVRLRPFVKRSATLPQASATPRSRAAGTRWASSLTPSRRTLSSQPPQCSP